ncbi:hypothetical protein RN001_001923 [Aquatica leii]|uniref:Uncharacterized protein n=1 Tax=Aquatica leii TaxID=1421715 RepID=A0AAN7Q874_9COLE|nr:hypothetical protein RN001_001923 [Aquatica leii]
MIPRETIFAFIFFATVFIVNGEQDSKSYETNDWIPIAGINGRNIRNQPIDRILHDPEEKQFFSENESIRTKKSSNDQYLREISLPANQPFHSQANPIHRVASNFEPQLNQGEVLASFFKQPSFQHREEPPLLFRQNNPTFSMPVVFPAPKQQYTFRQPFPAAQPSNINVYHQNQQASPFGFQAPIVSNFNQSISYEKLNPGIQTINQGLSPANMANSNDNFKESLVQSNQAKPILPTDSVQLVYVPVNSLNQKTQTAQRQILPEPQQNVQFHLLTQSQQPQIQRQPQEVLFTQQENVQPLQFSNSNIDPHKQQQLFSIQHDFAQQALNALNLQLQLQQGQIPNVVHPPPAPIVTTTTTTSAPTTETPKKRKSHQPPLAVYMGGDGDITVSNVLNLLKNAKTISVQDAVGPNSPQVFVGPQNLEAPEGYVKFDLPYLSSLETNRIERKVDQLPFFVAPVSYKAPPGYSKILLPAPHVGSVVVSQKEQEIHKHSVDSSISNSDSVKEFNNSFEEFNGQPQTLKFQSEINEGLHRFSNQIQSSSIVPPTRRIPLPGPVLTQTINQYELEQINNQFVPQFSSAPQEFPTLTLDNASNEYEDVSQQQDKDFQNVRFSNSYNNFKNSNRVRTHKTNFVTTMRPSASTQPAQEFVEIETKPKIEETKNRISTRPTQEQFINQYTVLEEFPIKSHSTIKTSEEVDFNSSIAPTLEFPNHSNEYHPIKQESDKFLVPINSGLLPTISSGKENNLDYHSQFSHSGTQQQSQNQLLNQGEKLQTTIASEIGNAPLLDPTLQSNENNQFVPIQSNHHISHKLVQRPVVQEEQTNKNQHLVTSEPLPIQHLSEPSVQHPNLQIKFATGSKDKQQFVSVQNSNEEVDYKLPAELPSIHPEIHTLINDLQDQSIRPLLVPVSIAPTHEYEYKPQHQISEVVPTERQPITQLTPIFYVSTTEASTTTRKQRGRQRARVTTTTYAPRRNVQRSRRPIARTTTEKIELQPDFSEEYNYFPTKASRDNQRIKSYKEQISTEVTQKPTIRSRYRTRPRTTTQPQITEQTTSSPFIQNNDFKQPQLLSGFQASKINPQSYMQFEHENIPNLQYQDQNASGEPLIITKESATERHRMNIDVLINHPITNKDRVEPTIISEPEGNSQFVRFSSNLDSDLETRKVETTTSSHVRIRGRFKSRAKPTQEPLTTTTSNHLTTSEKEKQEEFYGFFRPPNFHAPQQPYNPNYVSTTRRPVYISNTIQYEDQPLENSNNVNIYSNHVVSSTPSHFIGELVTKYTTTTEATEIITPEPQVSRSTPKSRIRTRPRLSKNIPKEEPQHFVTSTETRLRSRGRAHFVAPTKTKVETRDEDVEGGNYPKFFPKVESTTLRSKFQITIEPNLDGNENDDQLPFSSIRRSKVVPPEQAINSEENNYKFVSNKIPVDRKNIELQEESIATPVPSNIKNNKSNADIGSSIMEAVISEIDKVKNNDNYKIKSKSDINIKNENIKSTTSKPRRRGVWKLVKRPVDTFETAESQNVEKISANSLFNDKKPFVLQYVTTENDIILDRQLTTESPQPIPTTTVEPSFFEAFYKMFENSDTKENDSSKIEFSNHNEETTKIDDHIDTTTEIAFTVTNYESTLNPNNFKSLITDATVTEINVENIQTTTDSIIKETTNSNDTSQTDAWNLVKTSTATEISHETEICFKGKCVKSSDDK